MNLQDVLRDNHDYTDPECMEKLLIYLEELQDETEEFMLLLIEKLQDEVIDWEQPWYQLRAPITRPMKVTKIESSKETYSRTGFTKAEDDIIQNNWCNFVKEYDIPDKPLCFARWRNKTGLHDTSALIENARQFVVAYLARGLERNLYQVYKHIVTLFGAPNKGEYTDVELKIMDVCFYHCPDKAVVYLSQILAREPRGILKRLSVIFTGGVDKKRLQWTLELASKFLNSLLLHTGLPLKKLKNKKFPKEIWLEVQKDMDQYYLYLIHFWNVYLHVQLFVKCDVKLSRLRRKIFQILSRYPYQIWPDINWKQILEHLPSGFTHQFVQRVAYRLIADYPKFYKVPLYIIIAHGLNKLKSNRKLNRRLRTLKFKEGQLYVVRYKNKLVVQYIGVLFMYPH